jgi:tetratricopeptide (TPR) repeat protein
MHLNLSLKISDEIGNKDLPADSHRILGQVYLDLGNTRQAIAHCQKSLSIAKNIGHKNCEGNAYKILGKVYVSLKQWDKAKDHFRASLTVFKEINNEEEVTDVLKHLSTLQRFSLKVERAIPIVQRL